MTIVSNIQKFGSVNNRKRGLGFMKILRNNMHDEENQDLIYAMAENLDCQDDSYVGIFWYDVNKNELFGVNYTLAKDAAVYTTSSYGKEVRTTGILHEKVWNKEFHRKRDSRFSGDYTKIPRGRVFQIDGEYVIMTGSWISEYPQAKSLILDEFQLPDDAKFRTDIHWELGHGWSQEVL